MSSGEQLSLSYAGLVNDAAQSLRHDSDSPKIDAEVLMQHVIAKPLSWLIAYGDEIATNEHVREYYKLISSRQEGIPIAYLLGYKEFWSLKLKVTPAVLIPRADTEVLVEQALTRIEQGANPSVLDMGTGSGAIALAIAKERPHAQITALDSQKGALEIATENAASNGLLNVNFVLSNWFEQLPNKRFDMICCNPPYVAGGDPHLSQGDLRFEPEIALIGADDGLGDIRHIAKSCTDYLKPGGHLLIEHGYDQAVAVEQILEQAGFKKIKLYQDLNKLPRCTVANL